MSVVEVEVRVKIDGREVPSLDPYVRRLVVDEVEGFTVEQAADPGFLAPLGIHIDNLRFFTSLSAGEVRYRFGTVAENDYIGIEPGGLVLIVGGKMASDPTTNVQVQNPGTDPITLRGVTAGT